MSGNLTARLPGSRPNGSSRNGMADFAGYRFKGTPGWYPEKGVHRDKAEVMEPPRDPAETDVMRRARMLRDGYEARLEEFRKRNGGRWRPPRPWPMLRLRLTRRRSSRRSAPRFGRRKPHDH